MASMSRHDRNQYLLSFAAVGMSAFALIFAFFEMRSADRQLDASVWPYVDLSINLNRDSFELIVSNKGMGPALIHEFRLYLDGEPVDQPADLLAGVDYDQLNITTGSVPDTVLSGGEEFTAFRFEGEGLGLRLQDIVPGLDIDVCYCSINGACWNNFDSETFRDRTPECRPQTVDVEDELRNFRTPPGEAE